LATVERLSFYVLAIRASTARRFVRVRRSVLVNRAFVEELYPDVAGGMLLRLKDDRRTEIGVARVRTLKEPQGI
jgi:DNA-binding LytR/AlgR family response regulator